MNSSNYRFTLDMQSNQSQVSLPVRLGDTNRRLYVILTNGGTPFIMENGFRAVLFGRKGDGKILTNDCIIENNSTIRYDFTPNTASAPGVVDCEMRVYNVDGELVTSPRFVLVVDERVLVDDEVISGAEKTTLDKIIGSETARENAETTRTNAEIQRVDAETARAEAEALRLSSEETRVSNEQFRLNNEETRKSNETVRKEDEALRVEAELKRAKAADDMWALFRTITGDTKAHYVESINKIFDYIRSTNISRGDLLIFKDGNLDFDFVYLGPATSLEKSEAKENDRFFDNVNDFIGVTWEKSKTYVFDPIYSASCKLQVLSKRYNLPIGYEDLSSHIDEHNNDTDAHEDIRNEIATLDGLFDGFAESVSMTYVTHGHLNEKLLDKQDKLEFTDVVSGDVDRNLIPDVGAVNDAFNALVGEMLPNGYATKEELAEVESIAKGANQAKVFDSYYQMAEALNGYENDVLRVGQSILIRKMNVPDVWISGILEKKAYVAPNTIENHLLDSFSRGNSLSLGWYAISPLETQKVNLTEYATKKSLEDAVAAIDVIGNAFYEHKQSYEANVDFIGNELGEIKKDIAAVEGIAQQHINEAANAIKGKATGQIIRVDDVSPNEHTVKCKVRSKNLFNDLLDYKLATDASYTYENGTLTVKGQYANKHIPISEGKTYTFSCKSTRTGESGGGIYIRAYTEDLNSYVNLFSAISELSQTATVTVPKGYPVLRISFYGDSGGGPGSSTYTEIMLEEGSEATGYVPYVDATVARVTRYGKNLLDLSRATFTSATYNKNVNGITCKINNSYYSGVRVDYLNDFLLANKGKTLTFSIAEAIDDVLITLLIYGTRTSGKTNQEGSTTGEREISFAISDEFTEITGLEVRVNRKTEAFTDTTTVVRNMQVEVRDTASDFEVYKEAATCTPKADGTVEGIKSVASTMTLLTDTANVVINIEYNQDINVLNTKLVEALDAILKIQEALIGGTSQ